VEPHDPPLEPVPPALADALRGTFAFDGVLGRGGMATVYRARDLRHDRLVAIKVLDRAIANAMGAERFQREIRIAARLSHPNILPVHDSGQAAGELYYVMPCVTGGSLRDRLKREVHLGIEEAVRVARDVAGALAYAHAEGIIHRDIKPENILFEAGRAVVADFGIARVLDPEGGTGLTSSGGIAVGTPSYMSPEQATAEPHLDARTDQYSLGVVLYEMLAGNVPFMGATPRAVIARQVQDAPPPLRSVRPSTPEWLLALVDRALAKVPADRFPDMAALEAALAAGDLHATPATGRAVVPPARTRRPLALAAGAAALALLAAAAWRAWAAPEPDPRRVAVVPVAHADGDQRLEDAAEAITADLAGGLASVESLVVPSVSDVRPHARATVAELRTLLNVRWLVSGRLATTGDSVQLTADLVDTRDGRQVRGWRWRTGRSGLLAVQDSASVEIARELRQRLGAELRLLGRSAETRSVEAWDLVQRAARRRREGRMLADREDTTTAAGHFNAADSLARLARRKDAAWPEPLVEIGRVALERARHLPERSQARDADVQRALAYADSALALRPAGTAALRLRGEARLVLYMRSGSGGDSALLRSAEADLQGAAAPDGPEQAMALARLSQVARLRGAPVQAHDLARRAYESDRYLENAEEVLLRLCETSIEIDRPEDAQRWCAEGRRRHPGTWLFAYYALTQLVWQRGPQPTAARTWAAYDTLLATAPLEARTLEPEWRLLAAAALARAGLADSARRVMAAVLARSEVHVDQRFYQALVHANLGERARAVEVLADFVRRAPEMRDFVRTSALVAPLRTEPGFGALTAK
jgi:serine/threonine-protein kinase